MYDLTSFQRDLLYVIAGLDSPHGLAVKDELDDYYEKEIHHGRLYPNLDTLVDKGLSRRVNAINEPTPIRSPDAGAERSMPAATGKREPRLRLIPSRRNRSFPATSSDQRTYEQCSGAHSVSTLSRISLTTRYRSSKW